MVDQYVVVVVGQIEWDIFVGLFGVGVVVFVSGFYCLVVVYQGGKVFVEVVDGFVDVEVEVFKYVVVLGFIILYVVVVFQLVIGDMQVVVQKIQCLEFVFSYLYVEVVVFQFGEFGCIFYFDMDVFLYVQWIVWVVIQCVLEVFYMYVDYFFLW